MNGFWRRFFWPFLLYALVFCILARRGETSLIVAALIAGGLAALLAICMAVFIKMGDRGVSWRLVTNLGYWPGPVRGELARNLIGIAIVVGLCIAGAFLV